MAMVKTDLLQLSMSKVPMVKPLFALVIGIILGHYFNFPFVVYCPYLIFFCFMTLCITQFHKFLHHRKLLFSVTYYLIMLLLGIWIISIHKPTINTAHFSNHIFQQICGVIDDEPVVKEKTIRFPLRVRSITDSNKSLIVEGKVMITIWKDSLSKETFKYGDVLVFKNKVSQTVSPFNPNEFDYKRYLANKGIWHQCFLAAPDYKIIGRGAGNFILENALEIRQILIAKFAAYLNNPEAFQIAIALIFGYRSQIDTMTLDAFTNTGTVHVLSVSGLHVGLVFGLLTLVLDWLDRFKNGKVVRCTIIFVAVWIYVVLTGMSPPIMRAGIMISFFIVSTASGRRQVAVNTLVTSALFILLFAPHYLFDVGFQLSYSAILGILLIYPLLKKLWLPSNKWYRKIVEYSYVSIAAQLFTMPLALYYFGQFPTYFLLANLFIALPSTAIMYVGITLALCPFDSLNVFLAKLLDLFLGFSVDGLRIIALLPMSISKGIVWDSGQVVLLYLFFIFLLLAFNNKYKQMLYLALIVLLTLNTYTVFRRIYFNRYKGYRIYNVKAAIAIATIDEGKITLFSTFDSIQHAVLRYSVLPDLIRYGNENDIRFIKLRNDIRINYQIKVGKRNFLIVENKLDKLEGINYDCIIWRQNNPNDILTISKECKRSTIIIDGSNAQKNIDKVYFALENKHMIYLLKNNFAYVWEGE